MIFDIMNKGEFEAGDEMKRVRPVIFSDGKIRNLRFDLVIDSACFNLYFLSLRNFTSSVIN